MSNSLYSVKKFTILAFTFFAFLKATAQPDRVDALIPAPASVQKQQGAYTLPASIVINYDNREELKSMSERLATQLRSATGKQVGFGNNAPQIHLQLSVLKNLSNEAYVLDVTENGIKIEASDPAGLFYGIQTLLQLLPPAIHSSQVQEAIWDIPYVHIEDAPRLGWRGLMLDVSRHFFTVDEVKRFIDDMVKYKFNVMHWHLTDDQGWRIEIKSFPKLTSVGAWRVNKTGTFGNMSKPTANEPRDYGGFYTQEQIKEVVAYAKERHVNILPEIDVPGHSLAAVAAYPELSCTPGQYEPSSGDRFMVWEGGGFYGLIDNTLCPAKENVYEFLDKVFGEIAELFPFDYIHMGGDETARNFWGKNATIKAFMAKNKIKDLDEMQSYFVKRIEKIINAKGKKMIGWDEILDGGLAPNATVMSWRGMKGGIQAAKMGHEVVMTPTTFAYLDYMQGDRIMEPPVYASLRLKKVYEFNPFPDSIDAKYIIGAQGNLWTEQIYTLRQVQYMLWPRSFALAEIFWSKNTNRNFNQFINRIETHFPRLDYAETKWAPSIYEPDFKVARKGESGIELTLIPELEGVTMHYSFDNSFPDKYYPLYTTPVVIPKDASLVRVVSYKDGKPAGRFMSVTVDDLIKRLPKK